MRYLAYPYAIVESGTAMTDSQGNIRDMIELVLFTVPGERVNRPEFGCGVERLVFSPNSEEVANSVGYMVQSNLQRELGDHIIVHSVECHSEDSTLIISVSYSFIDSEKIESERYERSL